jgi:DNA-binding HxlR family transcriptional regulator
MLREALGLTKDSARIPKLSWDLFSSVCFSHRAAVVKAMRGPMQSSRIKKRALGRDPNLRMSANNVRDVMKYLLSEGIVQKVMIANRPHPRFELTDLGRTFQELLLNAST